AGRAHEQVVVHLVGANGPARVPGLVMNATGDDLRGLRPQGADVGGRLFDPVGALNDVAACFFPDSPHWASPWGVWRTSARAVGAFPSGSPSPGTAPVCLGRQAPRSAGARQSRRRA